MEHKGSKIDCEIVRLHQNIKMSRVYRVYPFDIIDRSQPQPYVLVLINNYADPTTKYMMVFPSYKTWTKLTEINEYTRRFLLKIDFENAIEDVQFGKIEEFETFVEDDWNVYRLNRNDEIVRDEKDEK